MLAKHGFIYLMAKVLPAVLSLGLISIYTRFLSPEQYGAYSLTVLTAGLINAVCMQWINLGVGRYFPEFTEEKQKIALLATSRALLLTIGGALVVLSLFASFFSRFLNLSIVFYAVGVLAIAQGWYDLNLKIKNANLNPVSYGATLASKSLVAFGLGYSAVYFGLGAKGPLFSLAAALLIASLVKLNIWSSVPWRLFDKNNLFKLWRYGAPLTGTYLLIFIIDASDRFFIDKMLGGSDLGTYSAAYELSQYSIGTIMSVVHLAAFPLVVSALSRQGIKAAQDQLKTTFSMLLAVAVPVTLGLITVAGNVASVVMGVKFSGDAIILIPWIALALFFSCIRSYYFDYAFQLSGSTRIQLIPIVAAAILNLILNYLLIPRYGVLGAAVSTIASFFVALIGSIILGRSCFSMPKLPKRDPAIIVLSAITMVWIVHGLQISNKIAELLVQIFLGSAIYCALLLVTNVLNSRAFVSSKISFLKR